MRRLLASVFFMVTVVAQHAQAVEIPLTAETTVRFASAEEGAAVLGKRDRFVKALSRFDRQVRLQTAGEATEEELLVNFRKQALDWSDEGIERITPIVKSIAERFQKIRAPLPKEVLLVFTTNELETGYSHCRENAIVIPQHVLRRSDDQLERLLVHELFHIISSHRVDLRRDLYAAIGFTLCDEIPLPESLKDRKITNPDAPIVDCYIELTDGGKKTLAAPVLYAATTEFDPQQKRGLMEYVTFRLLVLEQNTGKLTPALMENGQAIVVDPKKTPSFFEQVGKNTNYIIHPDEILADNFIKLVMGDQNIATPRVVDAMAKLLGK